MASTPPISPQKVVPPYGDNDREWMQPYPVPMILGR
ncbi:MAG: hypothetical protein Ct9H300mP32_5880 [Verrucomicrobiota bacterium]|nr:MAG: hypothetical protein Ct9H300mP32_5880 [Verrucomicrobiota bacterium]